LLNLRAEHFEWFNKEVAASVGIGERTLYRWLKEDPKFLAIWNEARSIQLAILADVQFDIMYPVAMGSRSVARRSLNKELWHIDKYIIISTRHPRNLFCGSPRALRAREGVNVNSN
jgi:hypothetical protein